MNLVITPQYIVNAVIAVAAFVAAMVYLIRPVRRGLERMSQLADALKGEPAIPELGKPERPGLFVTVAQLVSDVAQIAAAQRRDSAAIEEIRHELTENSGTSLKDGFKAFRSDVTADLSELKSDVAAIKDAADLRETERVGRESHAPMPAARAA